MSFNSGVGDVMDVAAGFTTGLSFFYAAAEPGTVAVWSGLDGTGVELASISLAATLVSGILSGFRLVPLSRVPRNWWFTVAELSSLGSTTSPLGPHPRAFPKLSTLGRCISLASLGIRCFARYRASQERRVAA